MPWHGSQRSGSMGPARPLLLHPPSRIKPTTSSPFPLHEKLAPQKRTPPPPPHHRASKESCDAGAARTAWGGPRAASRRTPTRAPGPRRRTSASSPTSRPTARAAGGRSPRPQGCCGAGRAAGCGGSTTCARTSSAATSRRRRTSSSSSSTSSSATSKPPPPTLARAHTPFNQRSRDRSTRRGIGRPAGATRVLIVRAFFSCRQVVADRREAAGPDGQRDQELLEHAHQAQAPSPRHRPADAPPARRRRRAGAAAAALPAGGAEAARRRGRRSGPPPPAAAGPFRGHLGLAGGLQPQQRRRAAVRHAASATAGAAAAAPRHRPQPVHQPGALPAAGGLHQPPTEAGRGGGDGAHGSGPQQRGGGGVPVPEQPGLPAGRRVRLRRRHLPAAGAMGSEFFTGGSLLQRPIV